MSGQRQFYGRLRGNSNRACAVTALPLACLCAAGGPRPARRIAGRLQVHRPAPQGEDAQRPFRRHLAHPGIGQIADASVSMRNVLIKAR